MVRAIAAHFPAASTKRLPVNHAMSGPISAATTASHKWRGGQRPHLHMETDKAIRQVCCSTEARQMA